MDEYIARNTAKRWLAFAVGTGVSAAETIDQVPAADVAPVVYGRWDTGRFNLETGNYEAQCIRCRNFSKEYGKPYCPNCGAKMDGGNS